LMNSRIEHVQLLIDAGANLDFQDQSGTTPLLFAANQNQYRVAYLLLQSGADFSIRNLAGVTMVWPIERNSFALSTDPEGWRQKVVDFLRDQGVEVNPHVSQEQ